MATKAGRQVVRTGAPGDAEFIAQTQAAGFVALLGAALPSVDWSQSVDVGSFRAAWELTLSQDSLPDAGALVAVEGAEPVGFAAYRPATVEAGTLRGDVDLANGTEVTALGIAPLAQNVGHGSRLLAAVADAAGGGSLQVWLVPADEPRVRFFQSAGFAPAGITRRLDTGRGEITEHLWFALLG